MTKRYGEHILENTLIPHGITFKKWDDIANDRTKITFKAETQYGTWVRHHYVSYDITNTETEDLAHRIIYEFKIWQKDMIENNKVESAKEQMTAFLAAKTVSFIGKY